MLLYNLFLFCYPKIAKLLGFFNPKAKQWTIGQQKVWEEIALYEKQLQGHPIIWIHAASYGEFEQGLPIIEAIKLKFPKYKIWLTFFSPSGYEHRKNDPAVDAVTYLPLDGPENAKAFIEKVNPQLIIFIKYEFWFYYLSAAKSNNIPTLLVSAIFRPDQLFFKWYGGFYRNMLALFTRVLVQSKDDYDLIAPIITNKKIFITGDTRYDRVVQTAQDKTSIEWMQLFSNHKTIVAGSTWKEDEELLSKTTAHFTQLNWIIVPHHVDARNIDACKMIFPKAITLTQFLENNIQQTKPIILIIDRIGVLRLLYKYAFVSYVGGGFSKDGIHNVLEPAAFGNPVIWGPNDVKYKEAIGLRNSQGGYLIKNEAELVMHLNELLQNSNLYNQIGNNANNFIITNAGATHKTMNELIKYLQAE
jgi:3-deoxy-D-manno-octulosonic-acid transferase